MFGWRPRRQRNGNIGTNAIREALLDNLRQRLQAVARTNDPAPLLDPAVPRMSGHLALIVATGARGDGVVREVALVLADVHWNRYQNLPEGQDKDDLRSCLTWSTVLQLEDPHLVPEPIRPLLAARGPNSPCLTGEPADVTSRAIAHHEEYERTRDVAQLQAAITLFRQALDATPARHRDRPRYLTNLGTALTSRFECTGEQSDLDEAITVGRQAVDSSPAGDPDRARRLHALGSTMRMRFGNTGLLSDLNEAIDLRRRAVEGAPARDQPIYLSSLGGALAIRFEHTGWLSDLDEAIAVSRRAVDATATDRHERPSMLSNLGSTLAIRFQRTGQLSDLDEAISVGRQAIDATPVGHVNRSALLSNVGNLLRNRFERTGEPDDLDNAITAGRQAVDTTRIGHFNRPMYLANLAGALATRFERTGMQHDVDEAITFGREAVGATLADDPDRSPRLSNLGTAFRFRFDKTGRLDDLDEAIAIGRQAVEAAPAGGVDRPGLLTNLGSALAIRFEHTGRRSDLQEAISLSRESTGVVAASPGRRLTAARQWGRYAVLDGDARGAVEAYVAAIQLLPLLAWHGLDQPTREHHLREYDGLASEAATAAIIAGDPHLAVELLEAARGILWTQALHLRHDVAAVRARDPRLASILDEARTILNDTVDRPGTGSPLERRQQAARQWDMAVTRIRHMAGFENFLRAVPFAELRAAADGGPVVIVNVSAHGSHALVLTPGPGAGLRVVDLPAVTAAIAAGKANTLLTAWRRAGSVDLATEEEDRQAVFDVLDWTWHSITEPVLAVLGYTRTPEGSLEQWPRLWWCPTGSCTVLPLHASGIHPRTRAEYKATGEPAAVADTVAGRVVSSYSPALTALIRSRSRPAPSTVRQLAIGVPDVPGQRSLTAVPKELAILKRYLPEPVRATHLLGPAATHDAVLTALTAHPWLHLSCHGSQDPADASRSAFHLQDAPLTLADLATLSLPDADLAYLAACQTATGDTRLLDESVHLAAALQLIGYRHVLATVWNVADTFAPAMADRFYAHLTNAGGPESIHAPRALHHAVDQLRQRHPDQPLLWAPYIHLGP